MELNITTIIYLFFRLAPFIIVCFFSLQSVFNQDLKGIIYLVGLVFACGLNILIGSFPGFENIISVGDELLPASARPMCRAIGLRNGELPISNLPLGQTVLGFTFFYLVYVIIKYNLALNNIPTLLIFPILILGDIFWNVSNQCNNALALFVSLIVGGGAGILWAYIIDSTGKVDLQMFNGLGTNNVCSRPTKTIYRCRERRVEDSKPTPTVDSSGKSSVIEASKTLDGYIHEIIGK
jgi:hypothetical protein